MNRACFDDKPNEELQRGTKAGKSKTSVAWGRSVWLKGPNWRRVGGKKEELEMTLEKQTRAGLWKASNATLNRLEFPLLAKERWKVFEPRDSICVLGGASLLRGETGAEYGKAGSRRMEGEGSVGYNRLRVGTKAFILGGNWSSIHTSGWSRKSSCHVSCRPGLLLSAVQRPLSGWMVSAPGCTDGARVGGSGVASWNCSPSTPREPLEAHAWAGRSSAF